jgi:hypothetical protein
MKTINTAKFLAESASGQAFDAEALVVKTVARLAKGEHLVWVPRLTRELRGTLTAAEVSSALVSATAAGRLELRPDSGINLLSAEDAALCPQSPSGLPLSYVVLQPVEA